MVRKHLRNFSRILRCRCTFGCIRRSTHRMGSSLVQRNLKIATSTIARVIETETYVDSPAPGHSYQRSRRSSSLRSSNSQGGILCSMEVDSEGIDNQDCRDAVRSRIGSWDSLWEGNSWILNALRINWLTWWEYWTAGIDGRTFSRWNQLGNWSRDQQEQWH